MLEWCPHCQAFKKTEYREYELNDPTEQQVIRVIATMCYACNYTIRSDTKSVKYRDLVSMRH